ncbi:hypothetical protein POM88_003673 [Heracleum sosnowskyi]|uniref:Uncharacterized protein n=1 Tax=Heracleum sosnowskyi TaxID=360622 RepID=A0AAD8JJ35_9APIA|nr:hypothetical protein POM88_003673 [Heracleum sosnowskyi]
MSLHLNKIFQSKHDFDDSNPEIDFTDSNPKVPEVDFNVSNVDGEDHSADRDGKKRKHDQDESGHTRKVGSSNGRGLKKRRKNYQPKRWKIDGDGSKRESSIIIEAQINTGKSAENMSCSGTMEAWGDHKNGAERVMISCELETQDDQDYGDSNGLSGNQLKNYSTKEFDVKDGEVEASPDIEVEVLHKDPHTPIADSKVIDDMMEDVRQVGECSKPENPRFRKEVEDILKKPYDKKEYDTLWLIVNLRKPMQGHKEDITYAKDVLGKSYLEEYHDLKKILDTFQNDLPRKLNVLRGFFLYKKLAWKGIFKPWLDESCMAIVPTIE